MKTLHRSNGIVVGRTKWKILEWWFNPEKILVVNNRTGHKKWTTPGAVEQAAAEGKCKITIV